VRKTVGGTAWYQLSHASYKVTAKRANVVTWWGTCSYRRLKVKIEKESCVCPICQHDLVRLKYSGDNAEILGLMRFRRCHGENLDFWSDLVEGGRRVWVEVDVDKGGWHDG
jgi:hypothetical protein